jgi:hypothetical protein
MAYSDKDRDRSRRPDAEDQEWLHRSGTRWPGDREVGWHRVRSAPCTWRRGARVDSLGQTTGMIFSGLASKPVVTVSPSLASKPVAQVSRFGLENWQL